MRQSPIFAFDTEFIGEHTYHPRLCLLQVATHDHIALIDPLAKINLTPFWELVADASFTKIVHAGLQDLEPVYRHLGRPGVNLFDVQIAAGFLSQSYPSSLAKITEHFLQTPVGRALKFSQWDHRPLSAAQMHYAADDVRYLVLLHQVLHEQLKTTSRSNWAAAAMRELEDPLLYDDDPVNLSLKPRDMERLSPRELAILRRLLIWRQQRARELDIPPRALVDNGVLCAMTYRPVNCESDLKNIRGLPRDVEKMYGAQLVEAVALGLNDPMPCKAAQPDDPVAHQALVREVWSSLETHCQAQHIAVNLVGSKRQLSHWLIDLQQGRCVDAHRWVQGWRREMLTPWWSAQFAHWALPMP